MLHMNTKSKYLYFNYLLMYFCKDDGISINIEHENYDDFCFD